MSGYISPNQVNYLVALGIEAELRGVRLLEFIEFECGVQVNKLEEITITRFQWIVNKLQEASGGNNRSGWTVRK